MKPGRTSGSAHMQDIQIGRNLIVHAGATRCNSLLRSHECFIGPFVAHANEKGYIVSRILKHLAQEVDESVGPGQCFDSWVTPALKGV